MRRELERIYLERDRKRKSLRSLKNRYFAIIYGSTLRGEPIRKIHRRLYDETVKRKPEYIDRHLLAMALKLANRAAKVPGDGGLLAAALFDMIHQSHADEKARKLIDHDARSAAEKEKAGLLERSIEENREKGRWFYLASRHADSAADHKDWQGRLYVDSEAPEEAISYAAARGLRTLQWVMGDPVWFVTRPNCRHYFVALTEDEVRRKPLKKLERRYKTYTKEGDREFQTPARRALEEYEDRLRMLRALNREYPLKKIEKEIQKTELLVKKWKNAI